MDISGTNLEMMFKGFSSKFNEFHQQTKTHWQSVAMDLKSSGSEEVYGWLSALPQLREWLGPRVLKQVKGSDYVIKNRKFEATIRVQRDHIEDDRIGVYSPQLRMMAHNAASHPDELVFDLLSKGFETACYDGQNFFDTEHPVEDKDDNVVSVSNMQDGALSPWFLLDTSRPIKPLVFQERVPYTPQHLVQDTNSHVFFNDEYIYGMRARVNAGFALWQMAFGSKAELNSANYAAARSALQSMRYDGGRIMGLMPTLLVVSPANESAARKLLKSAQIDGTSNEWADSAELLVCPYLTE